MQCVGFTFCVAVLRYFLHIKHLCEVLCWMQFASLFVCTLSPAMSLLVKLSPLVHVSCLVNSYFIFFLLYLQCLYVFISQNIFITWFCFTCVVVCQTCRQVSLVCYVPHIAAVLNQMSVSIWWIGYSCCMGLSINYNALRGDGVQKLLYEGKGVVFASVI